MLSTTTIGAAPRAPAWACAALATNAMSVTFSSGFDGVSNQTIRVRSSSVAASPAAPPAARSTYRASTPRGRATRSKKRYVPP